MTLSIQFDASDFDRVARIFDRLPSDMQAIAFRRAASRTRSVVERYYARFAAGHIKVPQKLIKQRMRSSLDGAAVELRVKSANIPLHEIGAAERGYGVHVRGRGRYEGAFVPTTSARRAAGLVLQRKGASRLPVQMLFGPNPAHAVGRTPKEYEDMLGEVARVEYRVVLLQQVAYLLTRA